MSKNILKSAIIAFLADLPKSKTDQFNKAFEFYRQSPNKNAFVERRINNAGYTQEGLENLIYDLKQLHQITEVDIKTYDKEVVLSPIDTPPVDTPPVDTPPVEAVDETKSLREEYPFLNDEDCPEELLIVVGKKISAWKRYQELHAKISSFDLDKENEESLSELTAKATEEYEDNQSLDAELKYYAKNKKVLAAHSSLVEYKAKKEVDLMSNDDLLKYIQSSKTFFSRAEKDLIKAKNVEKKSEINKKIKDREYMLNLVKNKLGVS